MNSMPTYRRGRTRPLTQREVDCQRTCGGIFWNIVLFIFIIAVPVTLFSLVQYHHQLLNTFNAVGSRIYAFSPSDSLTDQLDMVNKEDPIHYSSNNIKSSISDPSFGVHLDGGLKLHRRTEYCQWDQHTVQKCQTCTRTENGQSKSYDCNCYNEYHYTKMWRSHRINSFLFDQPGAHHNPQRDPYPSTSFLPDGRVLLDSVFDISQLLKVSLRASYRCLIYSPNGIKPTPGFLENIGTKYLGYVDRSRYEPVQNLRAFQNSEARTQNNFGYIGNNGWFFSPYESSMAENTFKYFVQFMEGSILDWQVGDLVPSCTAGDIRVRFDVVDPPSVSVLGKITSENKGGIAVLGEYNTATEKKDIHTIPLGLVHAGIKNFESMFEDEEQDSKNNILLARAACVIWGWVLCFKWSTYYSYSWDKGYFWLSGLGLAGLLNCSINLLLYSNGLKGVAMDIRFFGVLFISTLIMVFLNENKIKLIENVGSRQDSGHFDNTNRPGQKKRD